MVDETANLDPAGAAALEAHFLDPDAPNPARGCPAGELVPGRFRAKARTWRERHHPVSIEARHTKSAADRRVEFCPDRDGMAWLSAYLPADTAAGIWERTTAAARALQGPDEARTLAQLRADVAATWLLTGCATDGGAGTRIGGGGVGRGCAVPRAQVLITVPVLSLLGATEEPAVLDGYGPIPPSMARRLVADGAGSFYRVLTDPRDGAPLEIGRTSYRLPKAHAAMATAARRQMPVPRLQQPVPGQRSGPPPGLGRRRHHRDHQPGPALPQTPPASNTPPPGHPPRPAKTTRRAGPHRQAGTTPANTRTGNHPTGRRSSQRRTPSPTKDCPGYGIRECTRAVSRGSCR